MSRPRPGPSAIRRLFWASDLHLDFCSESALQEFVAGIPFQPGDALALTGDVSTAPWVGRHLRAIARLAQVPIFVVLGNHDFYFGSFAQVERQMTNLCRENPDLRWLSHTGVVRLSDQVCLTGHDGWADAGLGDYEGSTVELNDYVLIEDFAGLPKHLRRDRMQARAECAVRHLGDNLAALPSPIRQVILLTHVPPYAATCLAPDGSPADDHWLPHFTNRRLGELLLDVSDARPDVSLLVLCGHTHTRADVRIRPNLEVRVAGSVYGKPCIEQVIEVGGFPI